MLSQNQARSQWPARANGCLMYVRTKKMANVQQTVPRNRKLQEGVGRTRSKGKRGLEAASRISVVMTVLNVAASSVFGFERCGSVEADRRLIRSKGGKSPALPRRRARLLKINHAVIPRKGDDIQL